MHSSSLIYIMEVLLEEDIYIYIYIHIEETTNPKSVAKRA